MLVVTTILVLKRRIIDAWLCGHPLGDESATKGIKWSLNEYEEHTGLAIMMRRVSEAIVPV